VADFGYREYLFAEPEVVGELDLVGSLS